MYGLMDFVCPRVLQEDVELGWVWGLWVTAPVLTLSALLLPTGISSVPRLFGKGNQRISGG